MTKAAVVLSSRILDTYQLNPEKMESLVTRLAAVIADVDAELKSFAKFLQSV